MSMIAGLALVAASVVVPALLLLHANEKALNQWSQIGVALSPVGIFFSGAAFIGIAVTLFMQRRELQNQRVELSLTREEHARNSEFVIRRLHTDVIKMAIEDPELREVWPDVLPGVPETKKDRYCNLILNLQKVAYETHAIELAELRGALRYLMASRDMYLFWEKSRAARIGVTGGDEGEDIFTAAVDRAFEEAIQPPPRSLPAMLKDAAMQWRAVRKSRRGA